jgi:hypothetical protein
MCEFLFCVFQPGRLLLPRHGSMFSVACHRAPLSGFCVVSWFVRGSSSLSVDSAQSNTSQLARVTLITTRFPGFQVYFPLPFFAGWTRNCLPSKRQTQSKRKQAKRRPKTQNLGLPSCTAPRMGRIGRKEFSCTDCSVIHITRKQYTFSAVSLVFLRLFFPVSLLVTMIVFCVAIDLRCFCVLGVGFLCLNSL